MNNFEIECLYMGEKFSVIIDSAMCTESAVLDYLKEQKNDRYQEETGEEIDTYDDDFDVVNWCDIPPFAQDWYVLEKLMPEYERSSYDIDVFEAAHEADVQFADVDEAYAGKFDDDADFAYEMAIQLGYMDTKVSWPHSCIDWEKAASELMYDYCESNGHYFRNL